MLYTIVYIVMYNVLSVTMQAANAKVTTQKFQVT